MTIATPLSWREYFDRLIYAPAFWTLGDGDGPLVCSACGDGHTHVHDHGNNSNGHESGVHSNSECPSPDGFAGGGCQDGQASTAAGATVHKGSASMSSTGSAKTGKRKEQRVHMHNHTNLAGALFIRRL